MEEFYPYEIGSDHDGNIEADFKPWKDNLIQFIKANYIHGSFEEIKKDNIKGMEVKV